MHANDTNENRKLIYPELSYLITGLCFAAHNSLGRFARERQYANFIEKELKEVKVPYQREYRVDDNILDFVIDKKIILELKARRIVTRNDYYQAQRYLQKTNMKLAMLVNFRNRYLKPIRVIRIDTDARKKFV